jgi:hypothetical protein
MTRYPRCRPLVERLALAALLAVATPCLPNVAVAQPSQDPAVKEVAKQRYQEGVTAFDAGKWEEARTAFAQAYSLTQVPAVLLNIGLSEHKLGKCVDGGNHLIKFLREHKDATPEQKATAVTAIDDCKKKVAFVTLNVDAPGADITLGTTAMGKSPLADPFFVEPGTYTISATLGLRTGTTTIEAKKGQATTANIIVKGTGTDPGPGPGPGDPGPGPGPNVGPGPGPYPGPGPGPQPQPQPDSGREDFGYWYTHRPLAWVGTGLFAVGLGLGIGFTAASAQSSADAEFIADAIRNKAFADGVDGAPCGAADGQSGGDVYPQQCNQLRDALDVHDANVAVSIVGWVTAGVAAAGTVTYIMVDWYGGKKEPRSGGSQPSFMMAPVVSPEMQGVTAFGRF